MNCLEYRRLTLAEPRSRSAARLAHRLQCSGCARWTRGQARLDAAIDKALAVPLPDGLADRVAMRAAWQRRPQARWVSVAAGVAAVAAGAVLALQLLDRPALADAVIDHVYHEPELLLAADGAIAPARLAAVLARVDAHLSGDIGTVTHAGLCPVNGVLAAHLVVNGENGPIAVIVIPERRVAVAERIGDASFGGAIVPIEGGSVALVSVRGEPLDALIERAARTIAVRKTAAVRPG